MLLLQPFIKAFDDPSFKGYSGTFVAAQMTDAPDHDATSNTNTPLTASQIPCIEINDHAMLSHGESRLSGHAYGEAQNLAKDGTKNEWEELD